MKIRVKRGLMFLVVGADEIMMDCPEADAVARANDLLYAERITKQYDGKTLTVNQDTLKIEKVEPAEKGLPCL